MINKSLSNFLFAWMDKIINKCVLNKITLDSRLVIPGDLFIAIPGHKTDGRFYISQAIKKGVSAIIAEAPNGTLNGKIDKINNSIPILYFQQLNEHLSSLAGLFYQYPSHSLCLIGITGTNGKTTTTHLLAQWAKLLGENSAVMGTIGNGIIDNISPTSNTTCSAIEVQRLLAFFLKQKATFVSMEVSSHSLVQHRVNDLHFSVAGFTNLNHEHLDYHYNMLQYETAKWKLFTDLDVKHKVILIDDYTGRCWLEKLPETVIVSTNSNLLFSIIDKYINNNWLCANYVRYYLWGTDIYFFSSWGKGILHSSIIGEFNVSNILLALTIMLVLGYPLSVLLNTANQLQPIYGRMEIFRSNKKKLPTILIDYAHTPEALKRVLKTARSYCKGKLWCVFGCGGDRDRSKRSLMGAEVEKHADYAVITDDNPRMELRNNIFNDIKSGFVNKEKLEIISNRSEAIIKSVMKANSNDLVLIAGKGHEEYQIVGQKYVRYSDRIVVKELLKE